MEILFRMEKINEEGNEQPLALFPHNVADLRGNVTCYAHTGQHSAADYDYTMKKSRPASYEEYEPLIEELQSIGYELEVIKRRNYNKYLESYNNQ